VKERNAELRRAHDRGCAAQSPLRRIDRRIFPPARI
jgi:hypothetical protein